MPWDNKQLTRWLDRSAAGEADSFAQLARAVQDELFRFALRRGLNDADAAEMVQETLSRAYSLQDRWRGGNAAGWIVRIALNVLREQRRTRRRHAGAAVDLDLLPSEPAVDEEPRRQLLAAMEQLPERQRQALSLRFLDGLSVRQTAEIMQCAEGTVKAAVFAAMSSLRKTLKTTQQM